MWNEDGTPNVKAMRVEDITVNARGQWYVVLFEDQVVGFVKANLSAELTDEEIIDIATNADHGRNGCIGYGEIN